MAIQRTPVDPLGQEKSRSGLDGIRCKVVCPVFRNGDTTARATEERISEAVGLVCAAELEPVAPEQIAIEAVRPGTLFGSGVVDRLRTEVNDDPDSACDVVYVDGSVSAIQQRNLEKTWGRAVIDRTALILRIFGLRARTAEGRLQVELAQLMYQRSRLVHVWSHLERQRGGRGFLAGPGEAQIETDRRLIDDRITKLRRDIAAVKRTRSIQRRSRERVPYPVVALVGYTNAGKSTLFNRLTGADVVARDQLFATLDPTWRRLQLPSGQVAILTDTVGFISDLPHELIDAFHATLEEVQVADLILHVRDIAHDDTEQQKSDVEGVLAQLGIIDDADGRLIEVQNKADLLTPDAKDSVINQAFRSEVAAVLVSASTGEGLDRLLAVVDRRLRGNTTLFEVNLSPADGSTIAWLYRHGEVVARQDTGDAVTLVVRMSTLEAGRWQRRGGGTPASGHAAESGGSA